MIVYIPKHGRYVAGCMLKVRCYHNICKSSVLTCNEGIICTFASSPCLAAFEEPMRSLESFAGRHLEALSQIFGLSRWEMSVCYPKMSMARGWRFLRKDLSCGHFNEQDFVEG